MRGRSAPAATDPLSARLLETTERSLYAGIDAALEGNTVNDVSAAVQRVVESAGFSCVRDMVVWMRTAHARTPEVPNFKVRRRSPRLVPGMIICIEPMVNVGSWEIDIDRKDKWICRTANTRFQRILNTRSS